MSHQPLSLQRGAERTPARPARFAWSGAWLPPLAALAAAAAYTVLSRAWHADDTARFVGSLIAGALTWTLLRLAAEFAALRRLEQAIHRAREGLLEAAPDSGLAWTTAGRLIPEHNSTVATLAMMFRTVEECQTRFLDERNRINAILQSVPGALLGITDELQVSIANRHAETLFGAAPGALSGRGLFELLQLDDQGRNQLRDAFLYKHEVREQELMLNLGAGSRPFSVNLAFYTDGQDDIGGVMILQDVTERRQLLQMVAMREKLVAMGQLAAGVAHEMNTPLGNILGYAQLLRAGAAAHPTLRDYAEIIASETQRCSRVVQDLLAYARKDQCSGEACDVNEMVRELIDAFIHCRLRRYGIEIDLRLSPEAPLAEGGCGEIDIVLTNVLSNAIQALAHTPSPRIEVSTWVERGQAMIAIADNGPGVAPEARARLFDPFFTTKEVNQGSGLGLFISQAMVARRGGRIDLDAGHAPGARFVIRLPAIDRARTAAPVA
ncbi:MAG: histidine kinase dimerization/phospho-acceptor domain-containing protein [Burkholderiaceae bacterium]